MTPYLFHLLSRHQRLDEALRSERARPAPRLPRLLRLVRSIELVKRRLARSMAGAGPAYG